MAYTYRHFRKDTNEIFYIGIGKDNDGKYKRAYETQKRNKHWYNVVNKVGFYVDVVADNLTWMQACELESELIKKYGRCDLNEGGLVNMTDGGDGNTNPSLELRETARLKNLGKVLTPQHREKISHSLKGHGVSNETKERLKEVMKYSGMYGKTHSEETKQKMSNSTKQSMQIETRRNINKIAKSDKTLYIFCKDNIIVNATRIDMISKYGLSISGLYKLISGKSKSHKGWKLFGNTNNISYLCKK